MHGTILFGCIFFASRSARPCQGRELAEAARFRLRKRTSEIVKKMLEIVKKMLQIVKNVLENVTNS